MLCACVRARACVYHSKNCNFIFLQLDLQRVGQIGVPTVKDRMCDSAVCGHGCPAGHEGGNRSLRSKGAIIIFSVAL